MDRSEMDALLALMKQHGVAEFTLDARGDATTLSVKFAGAAPLAVHAVPVVTSPTATPAATGRAVSEGKTIRAPIVGTFYRAAAPDKAPYVEPGDRVRKGQVVCIVEAMKLMNQIESDVDGVVAEVLVENGAPVQFGQELFRVTAG